MDTCEFYEMQASSLLDGELGQDKELGFHEQIMLVDHLLACPSCRGFYEQARELQDLVDELPAAASDTEFAARNEVRPIDTGEHSGGRLAAHMTSPRWIWAAAAMIIFLICLFSGVLFVDSPDERAPLAMAPDANDAIDLRLASDGGHMDESRFVALTLELLRGDARYHRKMYQILTELQAGATPTEGETATALNRDEGGFSPAGDSEFRRRENPSGETTASAVF